MPGSNGDTSTRNLLLTAVIAMLGGGTVSGLSVDQIFGGKAAREERDAHIALVVAAAEKAANQYQDRIDRLDAKYEFCQEITQMIYADLQACHAAEMANDEMEPE